MLYLGNKQLKIPKNVTVLPCAKGCATWRRKTHTIKKSRALENTNYYYYFTTVEFPFYLEAFPVSFSKIC